VARRRKKKLKLEKGGKKKRRRGGLSIAALIQRTWRAKRKAMEELDKKRTCPNCGSYGKLGVQLNFGSSDDRYCVECYEEPLASRCKRMRADREREDRREKEARSKEKLKAKLAERRKKRRGKKKAKKKR
jgi:hypothetical protein